MCVHLSDLDVLLSLTQLIRTTNNICKISDSNPNTTKTKQKKHLK